MNSNLASLASPDEVDLPFAARDFVRLLSDTSQQLESDFENRDLRTWRLMLIQLG